MKKRMTALVAVMCAASMLMTGCQAKELSNEYEGRIAVGKCDIEEADDLTAEYGIRNVPTVIFIKNGQVVDKFVGSKSKGDVQAKFEALLG